MHLHDLFVETLCIVLYVMCTDAEPGTPRVTTTKTAWSSCKGRRPDDKPLAGFVCKGCTCSSENENHSCEEEEEE